ncbi:MAG: AbrB/MazE/SpoVT family DNA-binding domain-containing protein [Pyrinomonadaceae bacterium]
MRAQIIQIGNSQGIRIPKALLEETKISGEVELEVVPDGIFIRKLKKPRGDWEAIFGSLPDKDDDVIRTPTSTEFERKEWQW